MQVREMQTDGSGLEHVAIVELDHGHAAKRVTRAMLLPTSLLRAHDGQLVRLADLLEHPQNPPRAPRMLSVKDLQHFAHDIAAPAQWSNRPAKSRSSACSALTIAFFGLFERAMSMASSMIDANRT